MFIKVNTSSTSKLKKVYLVEGYRDKNGKVKHRAIKCYGDLNELEKHDPNILDKLRKEAKRMQGTHIRVDIDTSLSNSNTDINHNFGYFFLEGMYDSLKIDKFLKEYFQNKNSSIDLNGIVKLLVFSRILSPDSKKGTFENRTKYFEEFSNIKLDNIYKSLGYFDDMKEDFELFLHQQIKSKYDRDCSLVFYDVTNYYFETEIQDIDILDDEEIVVERGLRKKGVSKEHRPEPIVQMGLLIDNNGIPIAYKLFSGNTNDKATLVPVLEEIKAKYGIEKIIVVADKGLNSGQNLLYMNLNNDGYILSQQIRKRKKELIDKVLSEDEYVYNSSKTFKIKEWIEEKEVKDSNKKIHILKEKTICFWSKDYEEREKYKRGNLEEVIQKFKSNPSLYTASNAFGAKKYLKERHIDKETGEIKKKNSLLEFDEEKYNRDCQLDGYYMIVTSEINLTSEQIIEKYRGLSKIEESFRIIKSDLEGRPVYVWTKEHIQGHFFTCFLSLVLIRLLQYKLNYKLTATQIQEALNSANCQQINKGLYILSRQNDDYKKIEQRFNVSLDLTYSKIEEIRKYKKNIEDNI